MDVFNRPPSIAEDAVQYSIHLPSDASDKASAMAFAACILNLVESLQAGFIWHRDAFEVKVVPNPEKSGSWILEGRIRVGDSIDDEWCTVWLLKEISSKWDVITSVYDSDGEFLLIEAAEALPSWVTPNNSKNRVWIRNSRLHLVPLIHTSPNCKAPYSRQSNVDSDEDITEATDGDEFITVSDALKVIRDPLINTVAPPAVEEVVWKRIQGYPLALNAHVHTTKAYVPYDIVKALSFNPALVQKAVEAFYTRDAIELRAAHRMSRLPPHTSILAPVRMTRTAYAQLSGQKFFPPKIFGQWKEPEGSNEWRWKDIGMKIAVGFEMLYQESKTRATSNSLASHGMFVLSETVKDALQRDPEYQKYIGNLVSANYFKGELRDSELWKALENKAATAFVDARRVDDVSRPSFAGQVDFAIAHAKPLAESLDVGEDSEEWLSIDGDNFDQMLENRAGKRAKQDLNPMVVDVEVTESAEENITAQQAKQLKDLATKVETFVEGKGDVEGALFEDEDFSDEPFSDDDASDSIPEPESADSEKRTAERLSAMDKLVPALGPSEYGMMPPGYHENSQRVTPPTVASEVIEGKSLETITEGIEAAKSKPIRPPIICRDKYDGVDSDDETDIGEEDEDEEDERPQVVGEVEIDMNEEEEEFLEFSRQALGIDDEHWAQIIEDRKKRGAFLPPSARKFAVSSKPTPPQEPARPAATKPKLESFESVMRALDEVLAHNQPPKPTQTSSGTDQLNNTKGKATIEDEIAMEESPDFDFEAAMEAELKEVLESDDTDLADPVDYNLIKSFLESFKSQDGLSGPVSNLVGRLVPDFKLPRDIS